MAKKSKNDALVAQLLEKVEEKKAQIEKIKNPDYKTNLSLPMSFYGSNTRLNLNIASGEQLFSLLAYFEGMIKNISTFTKYNLEFKNDFYGFTLQEWRNDLILKIKQSQSQNQVTELRTIERTLNKLLSEDAKTNIELDKIAELLK